MIIAIDPGKTTGVCVGENINYLAAPLPTFDLSYVGEITWEQRFTFINALSKLAKDHFRALDGDKSCEPLEAIVIESFRLIPDKAQEQSYSEFPSVRIIGIVEAYAYLLGLSHLIVFQNPGQRHSAKFETEHYNVLKGSKHCRDAYQHLRYFILMNRHKLKGGR